MILESLCLLFLEFVDSCVGRNTTLDVHLLDDLHGFLGLQVVFVMLLHMNHLKMPGAPCIEIAILGHKVTHGKMLPGSFSEAAIKRNADLAGTL